MADIISNPEKLELSNKSKTANLMVEPFLNILVNKDNILRHKGRGDYQIYEEVLRDDQVKSTFQQRRLAVISSEWEVEPGEDNNRKARKAADALRENLKTINFDKITDQMLFGVFYGHAVAEIMWGVSDGLISIEDILVRDRSRFKYAVDDKLFLQVANLKYEQMPDRKFWTFNWGADNGDNPYGLGLAHALYWPVFFKRSDLKFWLVFLEKFASPTPIGTLPAGQANNPELRNKLMDALLSFSTDAAIIKPEGSMIELLEATRSGAATYEQMQSAMDAAISKIVLSQTMTTDNGSSLSQAQVHGGVRDMIVKADADMICESFNRTVVKWWCEYNFPGVTPPRVYRMTEPDEDLVQRADRDTKIKSLGFEPTEDYIATTYGEGWVKSQAANSVVDQNALNNTDQTAASFAEAFKLAGIKANNRVDQAALVEAARNFSQQYEDVMGERVRQLVAIADQSGDYETFREHLKNMVDLEPQANAVEKLERSGFIARLMGALRAQR